MSVDLDDPRARRALLRVPSFDAARGLAPVDVDGPERAGDWSDQVRRRVALAGFAVLQVDPDRSGPERLADLAAGLSLGDPFVPPVYGLGRRMDDGGVIRVAAAPDGGSEGAGTGFERRT